MITHIDLYDPIRDDYFPHEVEFEITGGYEPACYTLSNGDPGYPASCAEIEINSITSDLGEVVDWEKLDDKVIRRIERKYLKEAEAV